MDHFAVALARVLGIEKGYSNDPDDSGGATNWGITERLAHQYGYFGPMQEMPRGEAVRIYQAEFWNPLRCGQIAGFSAEVCYELFESGVNIGTQFAAKSLQRSLNVLNRQGRDYPDVVVDGKIGEKTIDALRDYLAKRHLPGELVLLRMLNSLQGTFYVELAERREKDEKFIFGWFLHRVQ